MEDNYGFIVSARKYRPETFDTVVGQRSTTTTLKNAIRTQHLAQAYLFCGPRGIGKTTCARIFAKTINCSNLSDDIEACNACESCESFNQNRSYSIHELDAASNNSVEDIRLLIEKVRIPPQVGKYSVYIIDEVHMLSQAAFNAFLKTLEEPPKHAIFIMATTEKHKILPTILSRCQIFDFNRIKVPDIVAYLQLIAKKENVKYEEDALNIIAQKADGAMRDALSVFDQICSFSENSITYQKVIENLNVLDYDYYFRLTDNFLNSNVTDSLIIFDEILGKGFDVHNFLYGLTRHFRDLLVCKAEKTQQLLEAGESIKQRYAEQSEICSDEFLFSCLEISNSCDLTLKTSKNQRLHTEIALIRLCNQVKKKNKPASDEDDILILNDKKQDQKYASGTVIKPESSSDKGTSDAGLGSRSEEKSDNPPVKSELPSIKSALESLNSNGKHNTDGSGSTDVESSGDLESDSDPEPDSFYESQSFTLEELRIIWFRYIEKLKKDSPRMYNILRNQDLLLSENGSILTLMFRNSAQISDFKSNFKSDLISYIKENTGSGSFVVHEEVIREEESNSVKYYTDLDKLKYMVKKNPALSKLKNDFNLDVE